MKKNKKKIIIGTLIILLAITPILLNIKNTNKQEVSKTISLIEKQSELEKEIKIEGYTIDNPNIILNPYGNSPLTALITFKTEEKVTPKVTIKGKDKLTTYTHTFSETKEHYLPIYGLYADTENQIIIEYIENNKTISKELTIKTEPLPEDIAIPTKVTADKSKLTNELYFYTPSSKGYTCAYDTNGDIRWYLTQNALWEINRLSNGHLLLSTENLVNNPYYTTGLYEIDLLGKIYKEYDLEGGYHHDYYEMENGNLLVATNDFYNEDGTVEDYIVELDREAGKIIKKYDLKDILDMKDTQNENYSTYDWFHNNSVWYDKNTNSITLSGRHQDAVINIDYDTGKLNWIIGDSTNWSKEYQKYFFTPVGKNFEWQWSQHAAMITPEGYVFILDNGNNKSKNKDEYVSAENSYTRGVMYKIDTNNMTIEQIWEYGKERGNSFYSPYISDVDYISKNHYIVHSGGIVYVDGKNSNQPAGFSTDTNTELKSTTVELLNNKIIFELDLPTNTYRVEKMSLYYENENYAKTIPEKLGTLGETTYTKKELNLLLNTKKINEEYQSHNITITKEIDRLSIKGTFQKGTEVNILLYQNYLTNIYEFKISKKPYTALCVDIFDDEETDTNLTLTKYINKDNLKGKYSIYIEIDGTIYNTKEYVEF